MPLSLGHWASANMVTLADPIPIPLLYSKQTTDGNNDSEPRALNRAASSSLRKPDNYAGDAKHNEGTDPSGSFPGQSIYSISVKGTINVRRLSLSGRHVHL